MTLVFTLMEASCLSSGSSSVNNDHTNTGFNFLIVTMIVLFLLLLHWWRIELICCVVFVFFVGLLWSNRSLKPSNIHSVHLEMCVNVEPLFSFKGSLKPLTLFFNYFILCCLTPSRLILKLPFYFNRLLVYSFTCWSHLFFVSFTKTDIFYFNKTNQIRWSTA